MLACHSCTESIQPTIDLLPVWSCNRRRVVCDPLWQSMQIEASFEVDREPLLRPLIERSVLDRESIDDGLAMVLSNRLGDQLMSSSALYDEFHKIFAVDRSISEASRRDLSSIRKNDPAVTSLLHPFLNFKGFLAAQAYRVAHALWLSDRRALAYFVQSRSSEVFGVDIHPGAVIGSGVFIDHGTGVVIGETAVVGNDVTILHGVTLGGTGKSSGDRHPKVGNGVFIGAAAQLLGNIVIGEDSRIGASSVVLKDVEPHSTVAGVPARVVRQPTRSRVSVA